MKTNFTLRIQHLALSFFLLLASSFAGNGQNLLSNPNFSNGSSSWNINNMPVEINPKSVYGGSGNNSVAEIDKQVGLRQKVSINAGLNYQISFMATRRTSGGTIAAPGIRLRIVGKSSGTEYLNYTRTFNNSSFAFTSITQTFTIPANSTDNQVYVELTAYNNNTTLGVIVDDFQLISFANGALPVQWAGFTASLRNNAAQLQWQTAAEWNSSYFVIERATNGNDFDSIGNKAAMGSSTGIQSYQFVDATIGNGSYAYRIRQVDIDGKTNFSKIIVLTQQATAAAVRVFPSAARSTINLMLNSDRAKTAMVMIMDASGRVVVKNTVAFQAGENQQSINISQLAGGAYFVQVRNADGSLLPAQRFCKVL